MSDLLAKIVKEYAPHDTHEAFAEGFGAYQQSDCKNSYDNGNLDVELGARTNSPTVGYSTR
jgi:hypothetical protein